MFLDHQLYFVMLVVQDPLVYQAHRRDKMSAK